MTQLLNCCRCSQLTKTLHAIPGYDFPPYTDLLGWPSFRALSAAVPEHSRSQPAPAIHASPAATVPKEEILKSVELTLNASQNSVRAVQTMVTGLSIFTGLIGIMSFGVILIYRNKVEKTEEALRAARTQIQSLTTKTSEADQKLATVTTELAGLTSQLKSLGTAKKDLEDGYTSISKLANGIQCVLQLRSTDEKIRLLHLQRLSQLVHPIAVNPMIEVLSNTRETRPLRLEAAFGLGRFSENQDLDQYWAPILACLGNVLSDNSTSVNVVSEVVRSALGYGEASRPLLPRVLEWSRHKDAEMRRVCAEAFGVAGIYDHDVVERLKQMEVSDTSKEVKAAADAATKQLNEKRRR